MTHNLKAALASSFDDPFIIETNAETEILIQFNTDPLVLSCCRYRHSNPETEDYNPTISHTSLNMAPDYLRDKVTQADYELADKIRRYYWGKLAFAKLRGNQMSKFRQDLSAFLSIKWDEPNKISDKYSGMLYKLPYFYEHDLLLVNEVFESEYHEIKKPRHNKDEVTLTYIRSVDEYQKRNPSIKYWFRDDFDNKFCVSIEKMNSLIPSWEHFIKNPVTIKGNYIERSYDTLHFYRVNPGWKIVG